MTKIVTEERKYDWYPKKGMKWNHIKCSIIITKGRRSMEKVWNTKQVQATRVTNMVNGKPTISMIYFKCQWS